MLFYVSAFLPLFGHYRQVGQQGAGQRGVGGHQQGAAGDNTNEEHTQVQHEQGAAGDNTHEEHTQVQHEQGAVVDNTHGEHTQVQHQQGA